MTCRSDLLHRALTSPSRAGHPIIEFLSACEVKQLPFRSTPPSSSSFSPVFFSASFQLPDPDNSVVDLPLVLDALSILALDDFVGQPNSVASISLTVSCSALNSPHLVCDMRVAIFDQVNFIISMTLMESEEGRVVGNAEHIVWRLLPAAVRRRPPPRQKQQQQQQQQQNILRSALSDHREVQSKLWSTNVLNIEAAQIEERSHRRVFIISANDANHMRISRGARPLLNMRNSLYGGAIAALAAELCSSAAAGRRQLLSVSARYFRPVPSQRTPVQVEVVASKATGSVLYFSVFFSLTSSADGSGRKHKQELAQVELIFKNRNPSSKL